MRCIFYLPIIACLTLISFYTSAQRTCATNEVYLQMLSNNPVFAKNQQEIEAFTQRFIKNGGSRMQSTTARGAATYIIPVVVHVVYHTTAQNISDAQVQSQIDVLNKDYQKLNADTAAVPSVFKPLIADCKIQFCLAKQNPGGNPTTGIIRKYTSKTSFSDNDAVKKSSSGGDDAWPASSYLNLWVCNLSNDLLGYAQFPGGPPATDGVVILYSAFGTTGTVKAPYNKGRTATHEVGHWLNLRHIWGDDYGDCTGSDLVGDTPNAADENYGCPTFPHVSCSNGPNSDMFMNYMDYTNDACMQMFTTGQKDRMWAVLQSGGARAAIVNSQGCSTPSGSCGTPNNLATSNISQSAATVSWNAVSGAISYRLQYKVSSASTYTTISGLTATSYTLTGLTASTKYTYKIQATCSGGAGSYSSTATFTTMATACTDKFEPNNTKSSAKFIGLNKNIKALIDTSDDLDFFKFTTTTSAPNFKVMLTDLPKDYDLKLFNPSGTQIGSSQNGSTSSESIAYNGGIAGTYRVEVFGFNGVYSATSCYTLKITTSSSSLKEDVTKTINIKSGVMVYPQPASGYTTIQFAGSEWKGNATLSVISQMGQLLSVKQINTDSRQYRLDVSNLANGMYYIKISNNSITVTQKIVVQH
ncbi:T9SS type A sorting domain-containing protein [Ilyomonas limi]|uniref:T9SS type A sorting domain-containing protein n=1 Tax=Ilyomonas limi TaxID=2575867 RepID=A0A4U3LA63_9BACT|nr:M43 family zinc metalloprotease [Ilyomonas limi]TKK71519.1 T9SS type A sorting domain-containing protein [Ilyomonas limi]